MGEGVCTPHPLASFLGSRVPSKWIEETLKAGYTIICDRYYYSGIVYSTAKRNPSLSLEWARAPDVGLPRPDRVVFLDLEPGEAERRGGFGEEKYEKREMQINVREIFGELSKISGFEGEDMRVLNAGKSKDEVRSDVWDIVLPRVEEVAAGEGRDLRFVLAWPEKARR